MILHMLSAEGIKMRKVCFIIPIVSTIILLLFTCMEWYLYFRQGEAGIYTGLNVMYMFLSFTMLLTISLLCSIISETEHQALGLKFNFLMPISRTGFYFAKAIWVSLLMFGCCLLILSGASVIWIAFSSQPLPFVFLMKQIFGCFAASLPVLAIQLFLSLRISNQTIPMSAGVIGAISSLFLARFTGRAAYILPWVYPSMASPFIKGYTNFILLGILLGGLLLSLGALRFRKMEIK